jgi:hypothetical protein
MPQSEAGLMEVKDKPRLDQYDEVARRTNSSPDISLWFLFLFLRWTLEIVLLGLSD